MLSHFSIKLFATTYSQRIFPFNKRITWNTTSVLCYDAFQFVILTSILSWVSVLFKINRTSIMLHALLVPLIVCQAFESLINFVLDFLAYPPNVELGFNLSCIRDMGMEVCCTLGMLEKHQAIELKKAGLTAYNHNLDTSREFYAKIITTRSYDERLETLKHAREAGINVCSGDFVL